MKTALVCIGTLFFLFVINRGYAQVSSDIPVDKIIVNASRDKLPKRVLLGVKTNLLYDLALTPNIGIEVPIGKKWSVNGEFARGWWLNSDQTFCWQLESWALEGRYWLFDSSDQESLTGWFAGAYTNMGLFDFQLQRDHGRQGDFFAAGLSGGYVRNIGHNLSFEFSLGLGYIFCNYRNYNVCDETLIANGSQKNYWSIIPQRANISLVWKIFRKHTKRIL